MLSIPASLMPEPNTALDRHQLFHNELTLVYKGIFPGSFIQGRYQQCMSPEATAGRAAGPLSNQTMVSRTMISRAESGRIAPTHRTFDL